MTGGYFFTGDLADVRVYKEALNDDKVNQLYQYGKTVLKNDFNF